MANYADVKAIIDTYIKRNGIKAITGNILNSVLNKMLTELGAGYQYGGMADPATDPGTPDYNVVYLAATAGTYTNFDCILLGEGEIALLKYNGSWSKDTVGDFYSRDDIDSMLADYVRQEPGKGLSTNDYTDEDKAKLDGIEDGAQVNVIEGVSVNGTRLQPDENKVVDVDVPTDLSELREDAEHRLVTDDDITEWDAKYDKPAGGIPADDLAQAVRDLLALADSSLQPEDIVQETGEQTGKVMSQKAVTDAVAAVDAEVSQLGQEVHNIYGNNVLVGSFKTGSLSAAGTIYTPTKYRVSSETIFSMAKGRTLTADAGYCFFLNKYVGETPQGLTADYTELTFQEDTKFKICIRKVTEDTSSTADINTFVNAVKCDTIMEHVYERLEGVEEDCTNNAERISELGEYISDEEFLKAVVDSNGVILNGIKRNRANYFPIIEAEKINGVDFNEFYSGVKEKDNDTLCTSIDVITERNSIGSRFDFTKVGVYDYYAAYDELTFMFKDFVKLSDIGTSQTPEGERASIDSNTYPIRHYQFMKTGGAATKRIVLCCANHGDSQNTEGGIVYNNPDGHWRNDNGDSPQNIIAPLFFLYDLLRNPNKNARYADLYENYIIDVIPVLNPWGVQNHSRGNGRGVDLNRNYAHNWESGTSYDLSNGSSAFSESESLAFKNFFESLDNVQFCCECHSRGNIIVPTTMSFLVFVPGNDQETLNIMQETKNELLQRYSNGFSVSSHNIASLDCWVNYEKNIPAFEPEFCQSLGDIHTRNSKAVNIQMTNLLQLIFFNMINE